MADIRMRPSPGLAPVGAVTVAAGVPVVAAPAPNASRAVNEINFQRPKFARIMAAIDLSRQPAK